MNLYHTMMDNYHCWYDQSKHWLQYANELSSYFFYIPKQPPTPHPQPPTPHPQFGWGVALSIKRQPPTPHPSFGWGVASSIEKQPPTPPPQNGNPQPHQGRIQTMTKYDTSESSLREDSENNTIWRIWILPTGGFRQWHNMMRLNPPYGRIQKVT